MIPNRVRKKIRNRAGGTRTAKSDAGRSPKSGTRGPKRGRGSGNISAGTKGFVIYNKF